MTARRWFVLFGAIAGLIAMVAWIGEIDLVIEDSVAPPTNQPTNPPGSTPTTSKP